MYELDEAQLSSLLSYKYPLIPVYFLHYQTKTNVIPQYLSIWGA